MSGLWNFDITSNAATQGFVLGSNDIRARLDAGVTLHNPGTNLSFTLEAYYDGIGITNYDAYGGSVKLSAPLN